MTELTRSLVQQGVLTPEGAARAAQAARDGDVATAAFELGLADEASLARALARHHECPAVELAKSAIPSANLDAVPADFCRAHRVLPLTVGRVEVVLAMANPDDLPTADEVRFVTGRKVLRYAALGAALLRALDGLERARREGAPAWRGPGAPALPDAAAAHAAVILPTDPSEVVELPEATASMEIVSLSEVTGAFQPAPRPAPPPRPAPRAAPPATATPAAAEPQAGERLTLRLEGVGVGKVALVADDDPDVRTLVAKVLEKLGCVVLQAADGRAALAQAREARPDLVVLDAMMPALHGFEVCRAIKGDPALHGARVVLCSAIYRGTAGADARAAFGADAFVEKPFRIEELTRVFKVALVGPVAAETVQERTAREEAAVLWRSAADALAADRPAQAADQARAAAEKDPWSAEAHYYLGHALAKLGRLFEAVAAYDRAAELRPDVDAAHQCLAQVYERLGFQKSAREAWARAVETCNDPARKRAMQARLLKLMGV
jgi:CheY-like chemotaxis protein